MNENRKRLSKRGRSSHRKGKTGERMALRWLKAHDMEAVRLDELEGDTALLDPPPFLPGRFYKVEVKWRQRVSRAVLIEALKQAPVVMFHEPRRGWMFALGQRFSELCRPHSLQHLGLPTYLELTILYPEDFLQFWRRGKGEKGKVK